jgi:hypothetical protein
MILRTLIRWTFGIDVIEAVERASRERDFAQESARMQARLHIAAAKERDAARADAHAFWTQRDAARDQVNDLTAELETLQKTNAMFRSLIAILRDCNREIDERNVYLEKLHGMTPGERLAAAKNDAPNRCTESKTVTMPLPKADEVQYRVDAWQIHGTNRWGIGVAIDVEWLDRRLSKLEYKACRR